MCMMKQCTTVEKDEGGSLNIDMERSLRFIVKFKKGKVQNNIESVLSFV